MVAPRTIWALPLAVFIYKRCCTLNRPESLNANFRYSCFVNTTAVHVGAGGHHALFLYLVLNGILARQSYTTFQKQDLNFVTFGVQCYFSKFLLFLGAVTDEKQAVATVFPAVIGNVVALTSDFLPPTFSCGLPEDGRLIIPTGQVMPFCFCVKLHRKNTFAVMKKKKRRIIQKIVAEYMVETWQTVLPSVWMMLDGSAHSVAVPFPWKQHCFSLGTQKVPVPPQSHEK